MVSPYKLYGGALRPDALSGLNPDFSSALDAMFAAAPPEVQRELGLQSAYRDIATQQRLWDASDKTGRTVARPGHSQHNKGMAADLFGFGLKGGGSVSDATKQWVHQNAGRFGLSFPMGYEPWHVQLASAGSGGNVAAIDAQMKAAGYSPEQRRNAIASIESSGSYTARGPEADPAGHHALGRYQVMDYNVAPWAKQYLKQDITPDQFMADPKLQDQLFDAVYGDYVSKYGERGAASKWFTGSETEPAVTDVNKKLTGKSYADRYMEALGATPHVSHPPNPTVGTTPTSPYTLTADNKKSGKQKFGEALADAVAGMGGSGKWQMPQIDPVPEAARVDAPVQPVFDTRQADATRQYLAALMARLNGQQQQGVA